MAIERVLRKVSEPVPLSADRLQFGKAKHIPEGAIRVSQSDVLRLQLKAIETYEPKRDVLPLKYGSYVLSALGAVSGVVLNYHYRRFLGLFTFGRGATFLPSVVLPSVVSLLVHSEGITKRLLLGQFDCPVCMEVRSTSFQVVTGFLYPLTMAPLSAVLIAKRYGLGRIPSLIDIRAIAGFLQRSLVGQKNILFALLALQTVGSFSIAHMEGQSFLKLMGSRMKSSDD